MRGKILSLSKNEDFKFLLNGKKINNKYITIFFKKLSNKNNKNLNISFLAQKKIGGAVKRNRIKRRLRSIMRDALKKINIKMEYAYLIISKRNVFDSKFSDIKETVLKDFKNIK